MNYWQMVKDSLRIFKASKLIWVFGFLAMLSSIPFLVLQYTQINSVLACLYILIFFPLVYFVMIANCGLVYAIHQVSRNEKLTFSEVWLQGRSKALYGLGIYLLAIPLCLIAGFLLRITAGFATKSPVLWLCATILITSFLVSFFVFGWCTVVIDDIRGWNTAWTSLLITCKNLLRVFVIIGAIYLVQLSLTELMGAILASGLFKAGLPFAFAFNIPTYLKLNGIPVITWMNWIFNIFFYPFQTILLVLGYFKFTKDISYPALVKNNPQPNASPTLPPPA